MIKLSLSWLFLLCFLLPGTAQTTFWTEKFITPDGWTLQDNWSISSGTLSFDWDPTLYNFDQAAVSPEITLDYHIEELIVTQSLQVYNPTENETAQLIILSGDEEFILWDYNLSSGNWGNLSGSDLTFSLQDFAGESIQIKFRTFGETTFNWSWWQVFKITIIANYDHDLMVSNLQGPKNIDVLESGNWVVEISNPGTNPISEYTVNLIDSRTGEIVDHIIEIYTIDPGDSKIFGFNWTPNTAYNTLMYGQVVAPDDQFTLKEMVVVMLNGFGKISPMIKFCTFSCNDVTGL